PRSIRERPGDGHRRPPRRRGGAGGGIARDNCGNGRDSPDRGARSRARAVVAMDALNKDGRKVMKALTGIIALSLAVSGVSACGRSHDVPEKAREPIAVTVVPVTAVETAERLEAG